MKIMIAEDSRKIRQRIRENLEDIVGGNKITETDNCRQTKELLQEDIPDVLILNIRLGDGTGFEVLSYLQEKKLHTKTIVFTDYSFPAYKTRALSMGARYFIDNSDDTSLIALIESLLTASEEKNREMITK